VKLKLSGIFTAIVLGACLHLQLVATALAQEGGTRRNWSKSQIKTRIHDYAQIKSAVLLQAERSAANILKEAAVETNWVKCRVGETPSVDAACSRPMTPLEVVLNPEMEPNQPHIARQHGLVFAPSDTREIQNAVITRSLVTSRETDEGNELPFRLSSGYLIEVEGRIGTQRDLKFLLDTGASISAVDSRFAEQIKLQRRPAESLSFDRKVAWEVATVPEVQFGQIKAQNIQMLVGHLIEYSDFAKKADAIIGMDLLKLRDFSIDYDAKKIIFHSRRREYSQASGGPLSQCVILEIQIQGHAVRLIVDTGFPGLLLYEPRLLKRVPELRTAGSPIAVSIGGRLKAKQVLLPDVVFGARNGEVSVLLVKAPSPDILPGIDGIVGLAPLKAHRVNFDFVAKAVSWE